MWERRSQIAKWALFPLLLFKLGLKLNIKENLLGREDEEQQWCHALSLTLSDLLDA